MDTQVRWAGSDRLGRWFVLFAVFALVFAQISVPGGVAAQSGALDDLVDLPGMVVTVADLNELGMEGFVHRNSQFVSAETFVNRRYGLFPGEAAEFEQLLEDGEAVAQYELILDLFDRDGIPTERVRSYIIQFGDNRAAENWFEFAEGSDKGDVRNAEEYGDLSELTESFGSTAEFDGAYAQDDYSVVVGSFYAGTQKLNLAPGGDDEPESPADREMESLVEILVEKIEAGSDGETPDLGASLLHFENSGLWFGTMDSQEIATFADVYTTVDGQYLPLEDEDAETAASYTADNEAWGIVNEYYYWGSFGYSADSAMPQFEFWAREWESDELAEGYVTDDEAGEELYDKAERIVEVDPIGENSAFFSVEYDDRGETVSGYMGFVQYGDVTYRLAITSLDPFDLEVLLDVFEEQDRCVTNGVCVAEIPFPAAEMGI